MAILAKRLIYNYSVLLGETFIYNLTDLQAYYDRLLPNYASIIKE